MCKARPHTNKLDFIQIEDFENTGVFKEAMDGIDGVIHVASVSERSEDSSAQTDEYDSPLLTTQKITRKNL